MSGSDADNTFSYPRPNLIVSSEGFTVEVQRSVIRYQETDRTIEVFAEALVSDPPTIAIRRSDVRTWQEPQQQTAVTGPDRVRVIANIQAAFAFKDWALVVE